MGWGGRTVREARDFHSEDTHMVCRRGAVLRAGVLCNVLFCCVQWQLVRVRDVMSAYLCLQIYLCEGLHKKGCFLTLL